MNIDNTKPNDVFAFTKWTLTLMTDEMFHLESQITEWTNKNNDKLQRTDKQNHYVLSHLNMKSQLPHDSIHKYACF